MVRYSKDTDNIVTLSLNMKGRTVNVINHEIGQAFLPVLEHLKMEKARGGLRGVILTSDKKTFLSGGDLEYLLNAEDAEEVFSFTETLKKFLRDLESPGVPVVAAINGSALGTGFEVALACHHRIVIDDPRIRLGHPEVNLGLMPGGGGVIRLMWLLGIEKAYTILTSGHRYSPQEAMRVGIIDDLAKNRKEMLEKAKTWLLENKEGRRPWDREHESIPGGTAKKASVAATIRNFSAQLAKLTHHNYPAPQAILNVLFEGSKVDFDTACKIEGRYYTSLVLSKATKNMIKTFWFDYNAIKSGENRPKGFGKFRPRKVGVIGAGMMGSGIAFACLRQGLHVVLKDVSYLIAERAREYVRKKLDELLEIGFIQEEDKIETLSRIKTTESSKEFEDCDLVIEAVFENKMVKQKVTREAEEFLDEYSLFASNTVSIPITQLATASVRPENYVGLHFFHPADEIPLVEIVKGEETSDETIARAFDFVNAIHKVPIIVKDDWGFYAARVQNTYILEGITMLQEGYPPALIENLGQKAGMPKGALALADDLGLELVLKYENQAAVHYGNKYIQHPAVAVLHKMLKELERPGRQKRAGFFAYHEGAERTIWPELTEHFPPADQEYDHEAIKERLLFAQVIEAVWCMQEKVIRSVPAANLGSVYGWGFPAFRGGVIQFVNDYGLDAFMAKCKAYEQTYGPRFKVPSFLRKLL
ncbi:3-hydroxyacyl-CoA dehydrogenase NAD-binding domain-containing protein [Flavilitoribacter nigricans]|uniref:3-hydroxybutyryl-CoA epimerase n=1 Tax=Flavilitoribacter nigricans (strain ATCC 23147 / DSM 23189 / NBRC 102662 / NCIMB 1420 / SS-2) TaxID=1122177 RepID=A0A2D0NA50_FLAN2|nr:3-hydroxyacyl-CoA dehydrogenase NAD-binding domain-containing protein [Flavilitoribacter nigricans]PHN05039.1 3-hydroxybutyryl-CoA epimerase [Flavilitoribacter nigricans DSM 23189 = NBRC 102662]